MLLFPPPLPNRFPSVYITSPIVHQHHHHHHLIFQPPLSATSTTTNFTDSSLPYSKRLYYASQNDIEGYSDDDVLPLQSRRYDFTPLLDYLSKKITTSTSTSTDSDSASSSPTSLDPTEFQLAESYRVVPGPLWHSLLKSLCTSSSSIGLAYAIVLWLQKHNLCFSYELLYSILIHALGQSEKLYEAFLLSQRQNLTPLTYNALISACARNNDLEKALNLITRMRQDGYPSDFVNYSLIIRSLMRKNRVDSAILQKLYREIECDKLELDVQLSNDIIVGFAKAGDLSKALEFLGVVQGSGLSVKTATLVAVIWALGNCGRTVEAEAIFEEMRDNGLKPRTRAYNALLRGYVKAGLLKDAEFVVSEMERSGVSPNEQTYSFLIDAYGNAGRWESARIVLKEMEASNVQPNAYVFSRILSSYRDKGEWQKSFQVLREMENSGVRPDRERWDDVKNLLAHMRSQGLVPNSVTYTTLIDIYGKSGRFNDAIECLDDMKAAGLKPSSTMYNALINAYAQRIIGERRRSLGHLDYFHCGSTSSDLGMCKSDHKEGLSEQAVSAFRAMRVDGLKPSLLALNSLINAFGEDRRDAEAFTVLQYMKENDLKPDVVTYTTLMKALIRVEKFDKVPSVYEEMILSGCTPDRKARAMLRSALKYMKQTLEL
ncbi:hypothetical protein H0E87_011465 [Populus deltoides]|uniref:Pentatricopeptide repeat-containing protein n=1 Tax=Populus deltoides TaxID=3696 RepID=A0A8T2YX38_POPDE|nr:hypothetical protein H0E87_011465 [Populus deltoides]